MWHNYDVNFEELKGKTITKIKDLEAGSDSVKFVCQDGSEYRMYHRLECCESVAVEEVVGDIEDILNVPVMEAREETNSDKPVKGDYQPASYTWTFYIIRTIKGTVTIRWLGESNGYYSETASFVQTKQAIKEGR